MYDSNSPSQPVNGQPKNLTVTIEAGNFCISSRTKVEGVISVLYNGSMVGIVLGAVPSAALSRNKGQKWSQQSYSGSGPGRIHHPVELQAGLTEAAG
ncbi:MAG: hypothetical protein LBP22_05060 [Deltaproteobacteria bacterium]|nr:hypothetical protein [Deltaproteobacteria bacterium]